MQEYFTGGCAAITGAGSGIGAALARQVAVLGMDVVIADISAERLDRTEAELNSLGARVLAVPTDVRDAAQVDRLSDAAYDRFGTVRLLVNNAGVESVGHIWDMSPETWARVQEVNANGTFHGIRSFVPRMGANPNPSSVVNVASIAAITSGTQNAAYFASKHAVLGMTECLHLECREQFPQMSVSVVCPAAVTTRIFEDALTDQVSPGSSTANKLEATRKHIRHDGITADNAAQRILAGAAEKQFWINTHPERFREIAANRAAMLTRLSAPQSNAWYPDIQNFGLRDSRG